MSDNKGWKPSLGMIGWITDVPVWPLEGLEYTKQNTLVEILDTLSRNNMALLPPESTYVELYRWIRRN